ncbi:hypothetical protein BX661DRAFT_170217 [Kickxella alabastrina]|uniref:uncharacterized protein n=1 Tax=Kickxella alabastrina TaxID=61397 RepID=UPI00221F8D2E|nr:uncharacterized protein BX661DRAFT_170217 [Kickxella alabastrina]KAI7831040.1 hypothetical protein BX661DRAFT_170217 [Kickxella alabastrina]
MSPNRGNPPKVIFQMSFPALEYLRLDNWHSDIKEISTALFPGTFPIFTFWDQFKRSSRFSGTNQRIWNFKIGIRCCNATDVDTFYEMTNRFFNRLRIDEVILRLRRFQRSFLAYPHWLTWRLVILYSEDTYTDALDQFTPDLASLSTAGHYPLR